jgi:hypothetical protein
VETTGAVETTAVADPRFSSADTVRPRLRLRLAVWVPPPPPPPPPPLLEDAIVAALSESLGCDATGPANSPAKPATDADDADGDLAGDADGCG